MHPIKQLLLGGAVGIAIGLIFAVYVPHYEIIEPEPYVSTYDPGPASKVRVWKGKIGDQDIEITREDIENY